VHSRRRPPPSTTFPAPGPRRHPPYGIGSTILLLALVGRVVHLLFRTDQSTAATWTPFQYQGIQELLLHGLANTLRAFAYAAVLSPVLGTVLAVGRLSEHRPVRGVATLVAGLALCNGSVLAEVFRTGVHSVDRGRREAACARGMRKTQVMTHVLVPQAVRAMLPTIISQLVVALKDTSLGHLITYEEFLHAGKLIASDPDYDLPFIPVVLVISPIRIGMSMLLSRFAHRVAGCQRRSPGTEAVETGPAEAGTLLPGRR
jgi:glutamate transport system permease protein